MSDEEVKNMGYCRPGGGWKWLFIAPLIIGAMLGVSYIVMLLWNCIIPGLFPSVNPLTYWHAVGLLILCKILFGGFRKGGHRGGWKQRRMMHRAWKEKWMNMSDEEKAKFKEEWRTRCGR
jgi:hypothetical protein